HQLGRKPIVVLLLRVDAAELGFLAQVAAGVQVGRLAHARLGVDELGGVLGLHERRPQVVLRFDKFLLINRHAVPENELVAPPYPIGEVGRRAGPRVPRRPWSRPPRRRAAGLRASRFPRRRRLSWFWPSGW
nr:hypothetical protein [Tanacetum cinerariifolium]